MTTPMTTEDDERRGKPGRRPKPREAIPDLSLEEWLAEMNRLIAAPATLERGNRLYGVTAQMCSCARSMVHQPNNVQRVTEVALRLQRVGGPLANHLQREILEALDGLSFRCKMVLMDLELPRQKNIAALLQAVPPAYKPCVEVLGLLHDFAYACLHLVKPRDAFANKRHAVALFILGQMAALVELPEALSFVRQALTKSEAAAKGALDFLEMYYPQRDDEKELAEALDDELEKILLAVIAESEDHSIVDGCLVVLVNAGVLADFEAKEIFDDWQERHDV